MSPKANWWEFLKNPEKGKFTVIPAKAGIHFYAFCLSSGFSRIGGGMKRRRSFTRTRKMDSGSRPE